MRLKRVTAPWTDSPQGNEPVTLAEAKSYLRQIENDEDTEIQREIRAARDWAESYTGRALINQTWELILDEWPAKTIDNPNRYLYLPKGQAQSITSLKYTDENGNTVDLATNSPGIQFVTYTDGEPYIAVGYDGSWPTIKAVIDPIRVRWVAGFGTAASDVPEQIRDAILFYIANRHEVRAATDQKGAKENLAEAILYPWKVNFVG